MPTDFIKFDKSASQEEKMRVLEQNAKTLDALQTEIANPSLGTIIKTGVMPEEKDTRDFMPDSYEKVALLDKNFLSFFEQISSLQVDDDFSEKLYKLLDSEDYRFNSYMAMSKLRIYESIVLLSNMSYEEGNVNASETLAYVHELQALFGALDEAMEEKALIDESTGNLNDIFFLQSGDKLTFLESLDKDITIDFYDRILSTLEELRNGHIKKCKYLNEKKFFEIRLDILRVLFARIGPNQFLILDVILKRSKGNSSYWEKMYALMDILAEVKPYYMELAKDKSATQRHLNYYNDILEFLKNKKRGI